MTHAMRGQIKFRSRLKLPYQQPITAAACICVPPSLMSHAPVTASSRLMNHIDKSNAFGIKVQAWTGMLTLATSGGVKLVIITLVTRNGLRCG